MEETHLPRIFEEEGLHFMGGLTDGFYGPYVWRETRMKSCAAELHEEELEYRAKLVELIYSRERNLLEKFVEAAGDQHAHARANLRIAQALLDAPDVPAAARALFMRSCAELENIV